MSEVFTYNTKITSRLADAVGQLGSEFTGFYTRSDFEDVVEKLRSIRRTGNLSRIPGTLQMLYMMFDECGVKYEKGKSDDYYAKLIDNLDLIEEDELEGKVLEGIYNLYKEYPKPSEYMARIVNRLADEKNQNHDDTLRLRILKQFVLRGNYLNDAKYGGKRQIKNYVKAKLGLTSVPDDETVFENLDDGVFNYLNGARNVDVKYDGKYGVIKLVDDLAEGNFRAEGSTKRGLYLFAMAFGMTYYAADGETIFDSKSDIDKNLFKDYYTNNLMRFLNNAYRQENVGGLESDPTGQGINYKNFAELIYVYYISRDMSSEDKIKGATSLIDEILSDESNRRPIVGEARHLVTEQCRHDFVETILDMNRDELKDYILENYNFNTCLDTFYIPTVATGDAENVEPVYARRGPLSLESEQNTAMENYNRILGLIKEENVDFAECRYGLCITRVARFVENMQRRIDDTTDANTAQKLRDFKDLIRAMDNFMRENIATVNRVTRTRMIVAYYYYYGAYMEYENSTDWRNFEEIFNNFKTEVDEYLEASGYQALDGKNLFDVLIVFSAYARINYTPEGTL